MVIIKLRWKKTVQMGEIQSSAAFSETQLECALYPAMEWLVFPEGDFAGLQWFFFFPVLCVKGIYEENKFHGWELPCISSILGIVQMHE